MRSVLIGGVAAIIIAVIAGVVLNSVSVSSAQQYSTENARI